MVGHSQERWVCNLAAAETLSYTPQTPKEIEKAHENLLRIISLFWL